MKAQSRAGIFAVLAAALYAVGIPFSKILLSHISETMMAAFLYLGAGVGVLIYSFFDKSDKGKEKLTKKELPYTIGMIVLDILAPIFLMFGISMTSSENVSLLSNLEIVATTLIALVFFKEVISKKLWIALTLIVIASFILSFDSNAALNFNQGSLFVLAACLCWGFENNCTRMLSNKSSSEIVILKGFFSGFGSFIIALIIGEKIPEIIWILPAMFLGFIAYGLSIKFYVIAQKDLGAAKTSCYYSIAPFLGVLFGVFLLKDVINLKFIIAFVLMIISTFLVARDTVTMEHQELNI